MYGVTDCMVEFGLKLLEEKLINIICCGTKKEFEKKIEELKKEIHTPNGKKNWDKWQISQHIGFRIIR